MKSHFGGHVSMIIAMCVLEGFRDYLVGNPVSEARVGLSISCLEKLAVPIQSSCVLL